jgi:predicted enzyme related to lactoylglutathione lyase
VNDLAVISIYVSNLKEAKGFYVGVLGLEDKGDMGPGCMLALGDSSFLLEPGGENNLENQSMKFANTVVCFGVESVKQAYEEIEKSGIPITMKYSEYSPEYAVFMISDPDGNIIEMVGIP